MIAKPGLARSCGGWSPRLKRGIQLLNTAWRTVLEKLKAGRLATPGPLLFDVGKENFLMLPLPVCAGKGFSILASR
ncbi:MAG: hypothetical protein ACREIA_00270 [Opitutaceae bacterium]